MDAAVETVLSELDGVFSSKEEQRIAKKDFLSGEDVFCFIPDWLWQLVKCGLERHRLASIESL